MSFEDMTGLEDAGKNGTGDREKEGQKTSYGMLVQVSNANTVRPQEVSGRKCFPTNRLNVPSFRIHRS